MFRWTFGRAMTGMLLSSLAACSSSPIGASPYGTGDRALAAANPIVGGPIDPFLSNGDAVLKAIDAIDARVGTRVRATRLEADQTNGLSVEIQVPAHHDQVDEYKVGIDGSLSGPTPVAITVLSGGPVTARDIDAEAFDPKAIGLEHLARTIRKGIAATHVPDARATDWQYGGGSDGRRYIYLEAARSRPVLVLGPHFDIVHVNF